MSALRLSLIVTQFLSFPAQAGFFSWCSYLAQRLTFQEVTFSNEEVEIIFFPGGHHTKLRLGEDVYGNECPGNSCAHHKFKALERLGGLGGGAQIRYRVRLTPDEIAAIRQYIKEGKFGRAIDCTHSACRALNKNAGVWIAPPFNVSPVANAFFMTMARYLPGTRVDRLLISGPRKANVGMIVSGVEGLVVTAVVLPGANAVAHALVELIK